jgi:hypothetical protein
MKKRPIDPRETSVAATFFEPVYQRLRQLHSPEKIDLLCFTKESNDAVRRLLEQSGATRNDRFRSDCFVEVWELRHDDPLITRICGTICELDKKISDAIGCLDGKFTGACGHLSWGDIHDEPHTRRHFLSRLLQENSARKCRPR